MTLSEFSTWALAQGSVGKYTDGTYVGECVSLINQYLARVHGIQAGAWGNAAAWASPTHPIRQWFTPVTTSQAGDIGVYTGGTYGHIWVYRASDIIEQNGRVARTVTISPDRNATVILRPKAGMPTASVTQGVDMINSDQVKDLYRVFLGREASQGEANSWVGEWARAFYGIKDSAEGQAYRAKIAAEKTATQNLAAQVADLSTRPTRAELDALQAKVVEETAKVDAAQKALDAAEKAKSEDTQLLNDTKGIFARLIARLFNR